MLGRQPEGEEEAMAAFMVIMIQVMEMYHLRARDQFFGFSMSSGDQVRRPFLSRWISPSCLSCRLRYGFACGLDTARLRASMSKVKGMRG